MAEISIITPTYQRPRGMLRKNIGCVLAQSFRDWEQIVCSDGGNEQVAEECVSEAKDNRIRYRFMTDKCDDFGNIIRRDMLAKEASGKYVVFYDDDNIMMPTFLDKMKAALESTGADFVVCPILYLVTKDSVVGFVKPRILQGNPIVTGNIDSLQVMAKRDALLKIGGWINAGYSSDGAVMEKMEKEFKHTRIEEILAIHM